MAIQKLSIEDFLKLAQQYPVFDVRSPGEYNHAHIPDAISLPLFTDEERKVVGTAYKQQSREAAIKIGLDFFGVKMKIMVEEAEKYTDQFYKEIKKPNAPDPPSGGLGVLVHCWRGGMRSAGVAWLLDLYGFKVYTLVGGYKVYRKWVLQQFEKEYPFTIIGGYTGSGKTLLLHQLQKQQKNIIDLEALANHKGSAFGSVGTQPAQEMFENLLAERLADVSWPLVERNALQSNNEQQSTAIYLEDESQRIGNIQIPMPLWNTMRKSPVLFLNIPFEERLNYITEEYGKGDKEKLVNSIIRIQKRLGGLETKNAINFLLEDNYKESFRILLCYYDKWYEKALNNRENLNTLLNKIPCKSVDTLINTKKLLSCHSASV
jgi:tRNA 2-selenouridine synthase